MPTTIKEVELRLYGMMFVDLVDKNINNTNLRIAENEQIIGGGEDVDGSRVNENVLLKEHLAKLIGVKEDLAKDGADAKLYLVVKNLGG